MNNVVVNILNSSFMWSGTCGPHTKFMFNYFKKLPNYFPVFVPFGILSSKTQPLALHLLNDSYLLLQIKLYIFNVLQVVYSRISSGLA